MTWSYRTVRYLDRDRGFGIHEVYYRPDGTVRAMSVDPVTFGGDTVDEVCDALEMALRDATRRPVFDEPDMWPPYDETGDAT
jgi:hypothetical protein